MRLKIKQLRRIIRESILNGPYAPEVNQRNHQRAMKDVYLFARDIAETSGPGLALERLAQYRQYRDFVDDCEARHSGPGEVPNEVFLDCAVDYCHDMSEKQINKFLTAMRA